MAKPVTIALAGNPNAGKTTLFNRLTGANQRTANYPGITVSYSVGTHRSDEGAELTVVDLPGAYSLIAHSPEEAIARRVLLEPGNGSPKVDLVCAVVDATNLDRSLYVATQLIELELPALVVLNMTDAAAAEGIEIDCDRLQSELGVPVVPTVATDPGTIPTLEAAIAAALQREEGGAVDLGVSAEVEARCAEDPSLDPVDVEIQARYRKVREIVTSAVKRPGGADPRTERIDRVVLNRWLGPLIMIAVFTVLFAAVFVLATYPMDLIEAGKGALIGLVGGWVGAGELGSLLTDGVIEGVGAVVVFLPQIALLFLIVAFLEDSGYLSRAAFILDRPLSRVGLSGRSFTPLLSSFACAIPGIMAARTIPSRRERLITTMVSPLMVCSARVPVYSLLIAAFIVPAYGALAGGATFVGLYLLHIVVAVIVAFVLGRTLLKGEPRPLMLELPPYRRPSWRNILTTTWDRCWDFMKNAGTIILAISIVLWFLASHPSLPVETELADAGATVTASEGVATDAAVPAVVETTALEYSYAGRIGHAMEPLIAPLGYDWKMGIAVLTSFAAREVFVGTMSTLYGLSEEDSTESTLVARVQSDRLSDGTPRYTLLTAFSLLIFFAFACQCMSTVAVVARETRGWRWPLFMLVYMTVLAYGLALIVYQGGRLIGLA